MYCKNCGGIIDGTSTYCKNCGINLNSIQNTNATDDNSSFVFAILGFFHSYSMTDIFFLYMKGKSLKEQSQPERVL